jgi:hypothetical protein
MTPRPGAEWHFRFYLLLPSIPDFPTRCRKDCHQAECIGSVKSNIGHLELAAGVSGVMKVLLQMKHKTLVRNGISVSIFCCRPFLIFPHDVERTVIKLNVRIENKSRA